MTGPAGLPGTESPAGVAEQAKASSSQTRRSGLRSTWAPWCEDYEQAGVLHWESGLWPVRVHSVHKRSEIFATGRGVTWHGELLLKRVDCVIAHFVNPDQLLTRTVIPTISDDDAG